MSTLTLKDGTEIFYKDQGEGPVLMFHHGWPLSSDDWDAQVIFFLKKEHSLQEQRFRKLNLI